MEAIMSDKVVLTDEERAGAETVAPEQPEPRFLTDARIAPDPLGRMKLEARQYEVLKTNGKIVGMKHVFDFEILLGNHPDARNNAVTTLQKMLERFRFDQQGNPSGIAPAGPDALRQLDALTRRPRG